MLPERSRQANELRKSRCIGASLTVQTLCDPHVRLDAETRNRRIRFRKVGARLRDDLVEGQSGDEVVDARAPRQSWILEGKLRRPIVQHVVIIPGFMSVLTLYARMLKCSQQERHQ